MTTTELVAIAAGGSTALGFIAKVLLDAIRGKGKEEVRPNCILDRSETIFKVNEIHKAAKEANDLAKDVNNNVMQDLAISQKNSENLNNLYIALNNIVNHQKQLIELQKDANNILLQIKKNGISM